MTSLPATRRTPRPPAAGIVGGLSVLMAIGTALLAVGHAGLEVPVLSQLGPEGNDPVWPAVAAFAAGAVLYLALAIGAFRVRRWTWPLGLLVNGVVVWQGVTMQRQPLTWVGIVLAGLIILLLLLPGGLRAFLGRRP